MSTALELVPVAASVGAIISAYHDGAELLAQIRAKRGPRAASQKNATLQESTSEELESSLNRGAQVVQSQFARDASRFGEQYTTGDRIACQAFKEVIIHLQSQMIVDLKIQSYQETITDFSALQDVADSSQDQVVMALLQLQQRVIMAGPIGSTKPLPMSWDPSLLSAQSQQHTSTQDDDTPGINAPIQSNPYSIYPPALQCNDNPFDSSHIPLSGASGVQPGSEKDTKAISQGSPIPNGFFPPPPAPLAHHYTLSQPPPPDTGFSSGPEETTSSKGKTSLFGSLGRHRKTSTTQYLLESVSRTSSTPAEPYLLPAIRGDQSPSATGLQQPFRRISTTASISTQNTSEASSIVESISSRNGLSPFQNDQAEYNLWKTPHNNALIHTNQGAQSFISSNTSRTSQETHPAQSFKQPVPSTITVITPKKETISAKDLLPCEANKYSGFCKGAWRLQIGDYKRALQERQRPGSMYNAVKFWQCIRCNFEGRLVQIDKKTKDFDQQVMLADGIQFRWVFLFKSHLECKNANVNPLRSTFGCMFCCAEGNGTPVFEGAQSLMDHLQEHRVRLPAGEVLYRMNCLIGTRAPVEADFDINLIAKAGITI
ncbi:MAG: hypothetical protein Q9182_004568 [Xanthomendoza sp. 2 TL-2023]